MSEDTNLKDKVMKWLLDEGVEVRKLEAPPQIRISWGFDVFTPPPLRINLKIFQPEKYNDRIIVLLGVQVSPEHMHELGNLGKEERIRFSSRMLKGLINAFSECSVVLQPSLTNFNTVTVARTLFVKELSRESLVATMIKMINAYLYIVASFNEEFPGIVRESRGTALTTHM